MSKILEYIKCYRIGFIPVAVIVFAYSAILYSSINQNKELTQLIREHNVSTTIGIPGNYLTLKNVSCLPTLPEKHKYELNLILKQYELELHALLYNKEVPDKDIEIAEYTLEYVSGSCANAT